MIQGTHIPPEDLTETILAVVRLARRRVTIISPVVEEAALAALREVLAPASRSRSSATLAPT